MSCTIIYKTFEADLCWLHYSLLSVDKFVSDCSEIVIYYHADCKEAFDKLMGIITIRIPIRTIPVVYDFHGYIKQMIVKLTCWKDVTTPYIMMIDSDCIFKDPFSPLLRIRDNKIHWREQARTQQNTNASEFKVWEKAVEGMTFGKMETYYMANGFPFIFLTETLRGAQEFFMNMHGQTYDEFCNQRLRKLNISITDPITTRFFDLATVFEEFEYIGWYAKNHTTDYMFSEDFCTPCPVVQYWSHGGFTPTIESELKTIVALRQS